MTINFDVEAESPLRRESAIRRLPNGAGIGGNSRPCSGSLRGPLRALRLCLLCVVLPAALVAGPLYARYRVFCDQLYPLAMSDMRLIDGRVSTTWCQRQLVKVNTTFNAFLLPEAPLTLYRSKPLTMIRELHLEDDMKEYWGFYLLKGSSVTITTCTRWPGSSLTIIRGHKHLHECAYIGDDSSEELDEIMETLNLNESVNFRSIEDSAPSNTPGMMKRHRPDIKFHHPGHVSHINHTLERDENHHHDDHDMDPKHMKQLLSKLYEKTQNKKYQLTIPDHIHMHRNQSVNINEQSNLKIGDEASHRQEISEQTISEEVFQDVLKKLNSLGDRGQNVLEKLNVILKQNNDQTKDLRKIIEETIDASKQKEKLSGENDFINVKKIKKTSKESKQADFNSKYEGSNEEEREQYLLRRKRELLLSMVKSLNDNDEEQDIGIEEGLTPDGIADHRGTVNETTLNDRSNSEFWSSFSSSEEALLNCAGLILNLPLTPHRMCEAHRPNKEALGNATLPNTVTYKVPSNGYYFFLFNSENEVTENYLRIQFDLDKTVYDVSNSVSRCANSTELCAMNLDFFSNEKLVLELPVRDNDSLWNQEFVVVSECEPRTMVYLIFVIAVPLVILLFAFQ